MTSNWGKNLKLTIHGTSHGDHIGAILENFPSGVRYDAERIAFHMRRRAPGQAHSTTRVEADIPQILSGFDECDGELRTNGQKIEMKIANTSQRSSDYGEMVVPRPGHADYPAYVKYGGKADLRGGGHFSGRLTAPLTWAGALCGLWLRERGIQAGAYIRQLGNIVEPLDYDGPDMIAHLWRRPTLEMLAEIERVGAEGDSIGATIECVVLGLPVGVGEHIFRGIEGTLASMLFAIPAVKGVQFGAGFDYAAMRGSEANDPFRYEGGKVVTATNNCGGVLGGMTNGMPLVFSVAFKPTPSIFLPQDSVNLVTGENETLQIKGRHDPCAALRALPVVEAAAAMALMDLMLD